MFSYERGSNDYINYELDIGSKTYNVYGNQDKKSTPIEELVIPGYYNNGQGRYKVNNIKDNAFDGFDDVDYFDIPDVEYMGSGVFNNSKGKLLCRGNKKHDNWKDDWNSNNNSTSWNYIGIYGVKDNIVYTICRDVNRSIYSTAIGYTSNLLDKATISSFLLIPTREIGDYCFYGKESLKEVTIPNSVKRVVISAFRGTILETINGGENIEEVDDYAFYKTKISSLPFEKNVKKIGKYSFGNCKYIESINFEKVETIGNYAFLNNSSLMVVFIPSTIMSMANSFDYITILYEDSYEKINGKGIYNAFCDCIYEINKKKQLNIKIIDNIKYLMLENEAILIDGSDAIGDIILPSEIDNIKLTTIGTSAFIFNNKINSVVLSENIEKIFRSAFLGCSSLKLIDLKNVKKIGSSFLDGTTNLKTIIWSNNLKEIDDLSGTGMETIIIPNTVEMIGSRAFLGSSNLTKVYIPSSVTKIGTGAFRDCNNNLVIYCEAESKPEGWDDNWNAGYPVVWRNRTKDYLKYNDFEYYIDNDQIYINSYLGNDTNVIIPSTIDEKEVIEIGDYCFYGKESLKEVIIPNTVKRVGVSAFRGTTLETINDGENIEEVDDYAFYKTKISSLPFEKNVKKIGKYSFGNCKYIESINFEKVETIGNYAFLNNSSLMVVFIPSTIMSMANSFDYITILYEDSYEKINGKGIYNAFCDCIYEINKKKQLNIKIIDNIKYLMLENEAILIDGSDAIGDIILPSEIDNIKLTTIGTSAFIFNNKINSVVLSENIEKIFRSAFLGCSSLKLIDLKNVKKIGSSFLDGTTNLKTIIWSNNLKEIDDLSGTGMETIIIPNTVEMIGSRAFLGSSNLTKVYIPSSVTKIGTGAFRDCNNNLVIYCEAESKPEGWDDNWNAGCLVVWGCKSLPTD